MMPLFACHLRRHFLIFCRCRFRFLLLFRYFLFLFAFFFAMPPLMLSFLFDADMIAAACGFIAACRRYLLMPPAAAAFLRHDAMLLSHYFHFAAFAAC